jgi:hypothetical protein
MEKENYIEKNVQLFYGLCSCKFGKLTKELFIVIVTIISSFSPLPRRLKIFGKNKPIFF